MLKDHVLAAVNPVRRRVPAPAVRALVRARTWADHRSPAVMARSRAEMAHLMDAEVDGDRLEELARAFAGWMRRRGEYRWHPEIVGRQEVVGGEHLRAAEVEGRGVVVSFLHHAHFDGSFLSLARQGFTLDAIVHPLMAAGGGGSNFMRQHTRLVSMGATLHSNQIGSAGIKELLQARRTVCVASDVKGRSRVRFLGKDRVGSSGAPRVAQQTGSPVVVMTFEEVGRNARVRLHEPLDPAAYETPEALLDAMLAIHEGFIRAWPEAYDEPLKRWGVPG